ncbi:FadR/GntR family transcriptional regulator [Aestuariimicrobium sp. T2.26MG-19.2B]|uniref:FadR/GntR family transcriptional regulator n=1 Tax=Aestuariimicrobium sp. T2.26MG-19.2B TaxID=3040679 RepID=UPI00247797F5|nr:FadR/GntR family transcriptional regulator [Aestuariimicrobium sp. T2.26MG-19.2B]CAI9409966.1 HTH-type transcriptional regulator LutR [Aestuariimicrobium sp. T2.26MG-19.2B]
MAVTDDAIEAIKQMIAAGSLRPGDRLPREADLAATLGLSRSSLREAVKALALIRVLDVRQGDGTYVASLSPSSLVDVMGFVAELAQDATVLQYMQLRRLLEPEVTALAAQTMTADEARALGDLLDELPSDPDIESLVANDAAFHSRIAEAADNPLISSLLHAVSGRTQRARVWRGLTQSGAVHRTIDEHRAIQQAIARGDSQAARAWATVHICGVEDWLRASLVDSAAEGARG